ncbi:MAG: RNA polymerase sigma factor [Phycisphaerales bacterium]|nr:RNA polymerase sigma factor [Phycisphaerales bacterium]
MSRPSSDALAELVQRGYRFAYSLTHDPAAAEDVLQDAWVSILRIGGPWTTEYLFSVIRNRFIDLRRRQNLVAFGPLEAAPERVAADSPETAPEWRIDAREVERALGALRTEERAVLFLAIVEEFSAQHIADLLGWPRNSVLSLLSRGKQHLRELLGAGRGAAT